MTTIKKVVLKFLCVILFVGMIGETCMVQTEAETVGAPVVKQGKYEVAYWKDFAKGCVTYTFDDGYDSHFTTVRDIFDKYGYKATMYLVVNFMYDAKWELAAEMARDGYEMGSHTVTHDYLTESNDDNEYSVSKSTIENKIGMPCLTVAYPYCYVPSTSAAAEYYISGRGCDGDVEQGSPYDYLNVGSITCGLQYGINATSMISMIEKARDNNGWAVFLIHGINSGEYDALGADNLESTLSFIAENDKDYYVATFVGATKYSKERDNVKLSEIGADDKSVTLVMEDGLDDDIYDSALSVRVENSKDWADVTVTQNGKEVNSEIKEGYIYFEAVPDKGEIIIKNSSSQTNATVEINGYQISTFEEGFRTVYSVNDPDSEVVKAGMLYGIGNVDASAMVIENAGTTIYNFEATDAGKMEVSFSTSATAQSYAMTMKFAKNTTFYNTKMNVRAYAKLSDGTYIYSDTVSYTVYKLANYLYQNLLMNNLDSHNYLYDNILSVVDSAYVKKDFAWNNSIVNPDDIF